MKRNLSLNSLACLIIVALLQSGCQKETFDPASSSGMDSYSKETSGDFRTGDGIIATSWMRLQLRLVRTTPGNVPPVASRTFGYTGVAMYEALVHGLPSGTSLVGQLNDLNSLPTPDPYLTYSWPLACNTAVAQISRYMFANTTATNLFSIDSLEDVNNLPFLSMPADKFDRSVDFGLDIADAIYAWSTTDGGHEAYNNLFPSSFVPPVGPQYWSPVGTQGPIPLLPYWGDNRSFIPNNTMASQPVAPPVYSTTPGTQFFQEAKQIYVMSQSLTADQIIIAQYWADGSGSITPPGHSISILAQLLEEGGMGLSACAKAFVRMGIAQADAFISCWKAKYDYNLVRPITYIQANFNLTWAPLIGTPPFPEYTSGHSTQSGAAAIVLSATFGYHFPFTDHSHDWLGFTPRSFDNFYDAAAEAAVSRMYGGIHFKTACDIGVACGKIIGQNVMTLNL